MLFISVLRLDVGDGSEQLPVNVHAEIHCSQSRRQNFPVWHKGTPTLHKGRVNQHTGLRELLFVVKYVENDVIPGQISVVQLQPNY